jgi:hypothetical protein
MDAMLDTPGLAGKSTSTRLPLGATSFNLCVAILISIPFDNIRKITN